MVSIVPLKLETDRCKAENARLRKRLEKNVREMTRDIAVGDGARLGSGAVDEVDRRLKRGERA